MKLLSKKFLGYFVTSVVLCISLSSLNASWAEENWKEFKKQHFIIYYKKAPRDFAETVWKAAEDYYDEIADNLGFTRYEGWLWDDRAKIYIYDDQEDYIQAGKQANWSHGVASPQNRIIRTFPTAHGFFDSTLPHELGHIIFREFIGFKAEVPLWFEEGIAMYQEKARRWGSDQIVKKAVEDGTFIPLDQLSLMTLRRTSDQETIRLFYAESASIVNYMINELGKHRFVWFCRKLEDGQPFEWALESIYVRFKKIEDLNKAWTEHLKR